MVLKETKSPCRNTSIGRKLFLWTILLMWNDQVDLALLLVLVLITLVQKIPQDILSYIYIAVSVPLPRAFYLARMSCFQFLFPLSLFLSRTLFFGDEKTTHVTFILKYCTDVELRVEDLNVGPQKNNVSFFSNFWTPPLVTILIKKERIILCSPSRNSIQRLDDVSYLFCILILRSEAQISDFFFFWMRDIIFNRVKKNI